MAVTDGEDQKLTHEEHRARALLLGALYLRTRGYYLMNPSSFRNRKRLDVKTLQELDMEEVEYRKDNARHASHEQSGKSWYPEDD